MRNTAVVCKYSIMQLLARDSTRDALRRGPTWRRRRTIPRGGEANGRCDSEMGISQVRRERKPDGPNFRCCRGEEGSPIEHDSAAQLLHGSGSGWMCGEFAINQATAAVRDDYEYVKQPERGGH